MARHTILLFTVAIHCALFSAYSCRKENGAAASPGRRSYSIVATNDRFTTRSIYEGGDTDINTICIWAYLDGKLDAEIFRRSSKGVWTDRNGNVSELSVRLQRDRQYRLYALVNMGEQEWQHYTDESTLSAMEYRTASYEALFAEGLPMCSDGAKVVFTGETDGNSIEIPLVRLVAKWTLTLAAAEGSTSALTVKSIRLLNAPSSVHPFALSKATETIQGDCDIGLSERICGSEELTAHFYVLENMQGTADGITAEDLKTEELCTFIEIEGEHLFSDRPSPESVYTLDREMKYRYFLGNGTPGNCDLERNTEYTSRFEFTDFGWTVDTYRSDIGRTLEDGTCYVTFCDAKGTPTKATTFTPSPANSTISIYYSVFPENLKTIVQSDIQDSHLRLLSSHTKAGSNLFRDTYANDYAARREKSEMVFTVSCPSKGISSSAVFTFPAKEDNGVEKRGD